MSRVLDFLRIGRAQTAAMEMFGLSLAGYIGGAPVGWIPYIVLLGLVIHLGGFGMNSASPTDLRLDRQDPAKWDHPIVAGRVTFSQAWTFVLGMHAIGFAMFGVLTWVTGTWSAWFPFLGFVVFGVLYNLTGKANKVAAGLEISTAFCLAFLAFGIMWTGRASTLLWAVTAFAWVLVCFQILCAGEVKELAQENEPNLLRRLGSRVGPGMLGAVSPGLAGVVGSGAVVSGDTEPFMLTGRGSLRLGVILSMGKAVALTAVAYEVSPGWSYIVLPVSFVGFLVYTFLLLMPGPFDRARRVRTMGIGEAGSYLLLVFALVPALWPWLWVAFIVLPVVWFTSMNYILWSRTGSAWAPGV